MLIVGFIAHVVVPATRPAASSVSRGAKNCKH